MRELFRQFSFPGGIPSHVAPETPRVDPRGRRARLRAHACLRCGVRQSRAARLLRRRRRRGRDRAARGELALEQVPEPAARRCGAADPAPERLQDREPDRARAHPGGRARRADGGLRASAAARHGRRPGAGARGLRRRTRRGARRDRGGEALRDPAEVADDRSPHAEGVDRPGGGGREAGRGHVALAPGADDRRPRQPRAPRRARGVDAQLPARRSSSTSGGRLVPELAALPPRGGEADERKPARERRRQARPRPPRLPRLRNRGERAGRAVQRGDPGTRHVSCAT